MMNNVRKATLQDLEQLVPLFNAYRVYYRKENDLAGASAFLKERLTNSDSVIFVAESDTTLVGFTQLYPLFSSVRMKKLWLLNDLYVDEKQRGKGFALALIDQAKGLCRESGACGMFLETEKANEAGNQLYPRAGFVLNEEHNFYDWSV
jgi:ribosomal protein S18 acetylase RimI-like enzyme